MTTKLETMSPLEGMTSKQLMQLQGGKKKGRGKTGKGRSRKGGSVLADMSVPAGLLFLNEFFKRRHGTKKGKFPKKRKATRKATRKARRGKK